MSYSFHRHLLLPKIKEALRIIRTNLEFMLNKVSEGTAKVIFVTSTIPKEGKTLFYFTEPSSTDNLNVYLRCLPDEGMAAKMLQSIPNDDHQSVIAIFSANKAIITGRDSLAIDSIPLSTIALMPASSTTIAAFLFDDGDGLSSNHSMKNFGAGVFMNGIDILIPANKNQYSTIYFNGRKMAIPKRPSSEGVMIAVFE